MTWIAASICAGEDCTYPSLISYSEITPVALFPWTPNQGALLKVSEIWHNAYKGHYSEEYAENIIVAKTGTTETATGALKKRLMGCVQQSDGTRLAYYMGIENYRAEAGAPALNVLPVDFVNILANWVAEGEFRSTVSNDVG